MPAQRQRRNAIRYNHAPMTDRPVVTRFAPSPTGALHVGGARTALFNWAFARQHGGRFILRIEDTDAARSTAEAARGIIRDLAWLGMDWDEGPDPQADNWDQGTNQLGGAGPYFQSQRRDIYDHYLQQLRDAGYAYDDAGAVRFRMPDQSMTVSDAVLGDVTVEADQPQMQDFVIYKSADAGGGPTYHFAVVVDDALMNVTHVIRGQEHLNNTVKHIALQQALGFESPTYAHIPLIFNPDGSKMSKRDKAKAARDAFKRAAQATGQSEDVYAKQIVDQDRALKDQLRQHLSNAAALSPTASTEELIAFVQGDNDQLDLANTVANITCCTLPEIDVDDFRRTGYLPEVLCNYLALLGWNPGGDVERFGEDPLGFVRDNFTLDRVQKGSAKFDRDKLYAFNQEFIATLDFPKFAGRLRAHLRQFHPEFEPIVNDQTTFEMFAEAYQPRCHVLSAAAEQGLFFVRAPKAEEYEAKAVKKNLAKNEGEGFAMLRDLRPRLEQIAPWSGEAAHALMQDIAREKDIKMGKVAQPVRVAVSGQGATPEIDKTLDILGRDETLKRIDTCLRDVEPIFMQPSQS
jgi:glutamyl-tRNA synthetase